MPHAVLGDDVVDLVLAGADVVAGAERRHDARNGVVFGVWLAPAIWLNQSPA